MIQPIHKSNVSDKLRPASGSLPANEGPKARGLQQGQERKEKTQKRHGMLVLPTMEGLCFERIKSLMYMEASGNYSVLHFKDGRQVMVCKTLRDVESMLPPRMFARIHRSHSVNLRYIRKYVRGKGGHVELLNGVCLVVSAGQRDAFFEAIERYF